MRRLASCLIATLLVLTACGPKKKAPTEGSGRIARTHVGVASSMRAPETHVKMAN
jgi:hypothetical protein